MFFLPSLQILTTTHRHMYTQTYICRLIRMIDIIIDVTEGLFAREMREM